MTICISAIGINNTEEVIVFATDHMISLSNTGPQFEHAIAKFKKIDGNTFVMFSGTTLLFEEILAKCDFKDKDFFQIAAEIHKSMAELRFEKIQREILLPANINLEGFNELLRQKVENDFVFQILDKSTKATLNSICLLVGFSEDKKAQMCEITEFTMTQLRDLNFGAIGSGSPQAINALLFQKHSKKDSLPVTLYNVFKAKRNSEVSVGVGKETDLIILDHKGLKNVGESVCCKLEEMYQGEFKLGKEHSNLKTIEQLVNGVEYEV